MDQDHNNGMNIFNNFWDGPKQDTIDLVLGNYIPAEAPDKLPLINAEKNKSGLRLLFRDLLGLLLLALAFTNYTGMVSPSTTVVLYFFSLIILLGYTMKNGGGDRYVVHAQLIPKKFF